MTITPFELYLILKLDSLIMLSCALIALGFGLLFLLGLITILNWDSNCSLWRDFPKTMKTLLVLFVLMPIIGTGLNLLVPTTKQIAIIIIAPKIINATLSNEDIQKIPSGLLRLANEWIEEARPAKAKEPTAQ